MHHIIFVIQYHLAWAYIRLDSYHCYLLCCFFQWFVFIQNFNYIFNLPFHGYVQVAKESADVIILDDNFATIVNVAKWGRSVYINIQKFVQFQLTVNIVALVLNFVCACISGMWDYEYLFFPPGITIIFVLGNNTIMTISTSHTGSAPLTAVQLLWVNMIMDTLGALALATEPPNDGLMKRSPVGRNVSFITKAMWRNIIGQSIYQLAVLAVLNFDGKQLLKLSGSDASDTLNTLIFNSFVFCQVCGTNQSGPTVLDIYSDFFLLWTSISSILNYFFIW